MNTRTIRNNHRGVRPARGMTLLDVLLAIFVFVIGMLALASLQGNLTRSSADANARTIGTNIAEELFERFRTFEQLRTAVGVRAYQDIVDQTVTRTRGGIDYTIGVDVTDYYFLPDGDGITSNTGDLPDNQDTTISDFKNVVLNVSWTGNEFNVGNGQSTTGRLGSGTLTISHIVPSSPQLGAAKVAEEDDDAVGIIPVSYNPGAQPDIIPITVNDNKFKESTTPEPIVRRKDELVETWFDVITYQGTSPDAVFQRREEFAAVSCECELHAATDEAGRLPTVWDGTEYVEGDMVYKQYGTSASNQQSQYCDVCCRDHHDTASNSDLAYRPWDPDGIHPHYTRSNQGTLMVAAVGDDYLEACRLVRKDGFFRVAQDFQMQKEIALPHDFLEDVGNAGDYSDYVVGAVQDHFDNPGQPFMDHSLTFEGDQTDNPIILPSADPVSDSRRLMARGIYTDDKNALLAATMAPCFPDWDDANCTLPPGTTELEILPFYDIQVTKLGRWSTNPIDDPVHITNEDFANNGYDRGVAELDGSEEGISQGTIRMENSNVGLIDTVPITNDPAAVYETADLHFQAGDGTVPPPSGSKIVSGTFTNAGGTSDVGAATIDGSDGVSCNRPSPGTFVCVIVPGTPYATITVSNYYKNAQTPLIVCSNNSVLTLVSWNNGDSATTNWTIFEIPVAGAAGASITIVKGTSCP